MTSKSTTTVAIVDDMQIVRYSVNSMLSDNGFTVAFEAGNGQECIEKISNQNTIPDIIILDLEMPVMDGFQTADTLKRNWPQIKIIAVSGKDDSNHVNRILQAGAHCFFSKHNDPIGLIPIINSIISEQNEPLQTN